MAELTREPGSNAAPSIAKMLLAHGTRTASSTSSSANAASSTSWTAGAGDFACRIGLRPRPGGYLVLIEAFLDGLQNLNRARTQGWAGVSAGSQSGRDGGTWRGDGRRAKDSRYLAASSSTRVAGPAISSSVEVQACVRSQTSQT